MLFLSPLSAGGIEPRVVIRPVPAGYAAAVEATGFPGKNVLEAVNSGQISQVIYEVKIYRENLGLLALIGDTLMHELSVTYEAFRDTFTEHYEVNTHFYPNGQAQNEYRFTKPDHLIRFLSSAEKITIPETLFEDQPDLSRYYLLTKVTVVEQKLLPPFTLAAIFYPHLRTSSQWVKTEFISTP